ncbi:hypothetical protein ADUPG1_001665, partial [Aduncisulcus paluster]
IGDGIKSIGKVINARAFGFAEIHRNPRVSGFCAGVCGRINFPDYVYSRESSNSLVGEEQKEGIVIDEGNVSGKGDFVWIVPLKKNKRKESLKYKGPVLVKEVFSPSMRETKKNTK